MSIKDNAETINIRILNREFQFKCDYLGKEQLCNAANYLNNSLEMVKQSGKVIDYERIIVMAALNICHESLLQMQNQQISVDKLKKRMQNLIEKIDSIPFTN